MKEILVYNFEDVDFETIVYASPEKKKPAGFFSNISINDDNLYLEFNAVKTSDLVSLYNNKILGDVNLNPDLLFFNQFDEHFKNIALQTKKRRFNTEIPKEVIGDFYTPLIYDNQFESFM